MTPDCRDGLDNDHDGFIDFEEDAGCDGPDDRLETPPLTIDILPGDDSNVFLLDRRRILQVAILASHEFGPADFDSSTLEFGPGSTEPIHRSNGHLQDIDRDGLLDWFVHFPVSDANIYPDDEMACLQLRDHSGAIHEGCDAIKPESL
jgi:hypothetical protein